MSWPAPWVDSARAADSPLDARRRREHARSIAETETDGQGTALLGGDIHASMMASEQDDADDAFVPPGPENATVCADGQADRETSAEQADVEMPPDALDA